jgi:hypothetical protein
MDPHQPPAAEPPVGKPESRGLSLQAPATRREVVLFGLLVLALVWFMTVREPRIVYVLPDEPARAGRLT